MRLLRQTEQPLIDLQIVKTVLERRRCRGALLVRTGVHDRFLA
jgi:hypothetical protein